MPYRRRRRRRRRYYRRGLSKAQYRAVNKIIDKKAELKYHDTAATGQGMTNTGVIIPLTAVASGDQDDQRSGNKINVKSLQFKAQIAKQGVDVSCRVVLFKFYRPVPGSNPASTDIFVTSGTLHTLAKAGTASFQILYDRTFNQLITQSPTRVISFYRKMNTDIHYSSDTSNNWTKNPLFLYVISDNVTPSVIDYQARIRFTDI